MRARLALCAIWLGLLSTGCALVGSAADHAVYSARESLEDRRERARDRKWAEAAWNGFHCVRPGVPYSEDYADGFQEGFADYLYAGGPGEPPPLPPRRYRAPAYQTPQGYQAIEQWFAGYRRGAAVAQDGGFRRWITGPSSLRAPEAAAPPAPPPSEPVPEKPLEQLPPPTKEASVPREAPPASPEEASVPPEPLNLVIKALEDEVPPPGTAPPVPGPQESAGTGNPGPAASRAGDATPGGEQGTSVPPEGPKEANNVGWWYVRRGAQAPLAVPVLDEPDPQQVPQPLGAPGNVTPAPARAGAAPGAGAQPGTGNAGWWYLRPNRGYLPEP
jgi:hypothetical protein